MVVAALCSACCSCPAPGRLIFPSGNAMSWEAGRAVGLLRTACQSRQLPAWVGRPQVPAALAGQLCAACHLPCNPSQKAWRPGNLFSREPCMATAWTAVLAALGGKLGSHSPPAHSWAWQPHPPPACSCHACPPCPPAGRQILSPFSSACLETYMLQWSQASSPPAHQEAVHCRRLALLRLPRPGLSQAPPWQAGPSTQAARVFLGAGQACRPRPPGPACLPVKCPACPPEHHCPSIQNSLQKCPPICIPPLILSVKFRVRAQAVSWGIRAAIQGRVSPAPAGRQQVSAWRQVA